MIPAIQNPLTHAIGWTLIHFAWQGTVIALGLSIALIAMRRASARLRYGAACAAMAAMVLGFGWTLASLWPRSAPPASTSPSPISEMRAAAGMDPETSIPPAADDRIAWLAALWVLGVCCFSTRSVCGWLGAQRLRGTGVCAVPEHWRQKLLVLVERIKVPRPVVLLESSLTDVPVVIGFLRPVILLPVGLLSGFPAEHVEYFLMHELGHIGRWDYVVNLLQSLAEDLLFYHPAVWWVSRTIRRERENCCDDIAASLGDPHQFAAALAALEENRNAGFQTALAANGGDLIHRIQRLLGQPQSRGIFVAPLLLSGILLASFGVITRAEPQPQTASVGQAARLEPYRRWLEQEVPYIITEAERRAFQSLTKEDELQKFIEQFWILRDPSPGTEQNEFREEHYRRIAYANGKFWYGEVPGWKSDRGALYIRFGPPDELESHPGTATASAREKWLYRFLAELGTQIVMEFVDSTGTGEYRMTRDPAANPRAAAPSALASLGERAQRLAQGMRRFEDRLKQADLTPEQTLQMAAEEEGMLSVLRRLEGEIEKTARELDLTQPNAAARLREGLNSTQSDEIQRRMDFSAEYIRRGMGAQILPWLPPVTRALDDLSDKVRQAQEALPQ